MAKKKKAPDEYCCYTMKITEYALGYCARLNNENQHDECFDLSLEVELLEPIKGITIGGLVLYGKNDYSGGSLNYGKDKYLHGCLWMGIAGTTALINLLSVGIVPQFVLWGSVFRYRSASITDVSWYTPGHPELVE